jgi:DNA repair protein RadC
VSKENDIKSKVGEADPPLLNWSNRAEQKRPAEIDSVEWNSSTKVLAEFLSALGVADPGRIARSLIEEFGSLSGFLSASWWRLTRVTGPRLARTIQSSHCLMRAMLEEKIPEGPIVTRSNEIIDFLQVEMGFLDHEQLLALYVDQKSRVMRIERLALGSFKEVSVDKRKIIGCALTIGAAAFILVHNHPSGNPQPSIADLRVTNELKDLASGFDIELLDHLIVARGRIASITDYWNEARMTAPPGSVTDAQFDTLHPIEPPPILVEPAARRAFVQLTQRLVDVAIEITDVIDGDPDVEANGDEFEGSDGI